MDLVPDRIRRVMATLEARDAADRIDGTPQVKRLRAIAPEVGQFLLTVVLATRPKTLVEIGTSGGYSTLWLAIGAERVGGRVVTFEVDPAKVALARETFTDAGVERFVELRHGDGGLGLAEFHAEADVVFLDAEKDDYVRLLGPAIDALRPGGLLIADNLISHAAELEGFRDVALAESRLHGLVVPIGRGELVAVRL